MKLTTKQIADMRTAIKYLSSVNRDTGFPMFDLGFTANYAMAMALDKTKGSNSANTECLELGRILLDPKLTEEGRKDAQARLLFLESLEAELDLPKIKTAEITCKGLTPPPEVLAMLAPLFT